MRSEGDRQPGKRLASNETDKAPKEEKQKKTSRLTRQQKLLIALAVVTGLHLWKRNVLLSIGAGTVVYMVLVQVVFA